MDEELAYVVGAEIKQVIREQRHLSMNKAGLEFLMSMGLTVKDPGERAHLLRIAAQVLTPIHLEAPLSPRVLRRVQVGR